MVSHGRRALGKGVNWPDSLIIVVNCGHSWCIRGSHGSCYPVISLARCILIRTSVIPSDMGDDLILVSKRSNCTSFMLHIYIATNVDDDNYLYQILFDNTCMLSIGCKHMMFSTLIWLKLA
jgi:hypothetical protein